MSRKILVGWLEDLYWKNIEDSIEKYLGKDGIDLRLMSSVVDVLSMKSTLTSEKRRFDLLILDCKMDEESHSMTSRIKDLKQAAKRIDIWAIDYYKRNLAPLGGPHIWSFFRKNALEPLDKRKNALEPLDKTDIRTVVYSADSEIINHYKVLDELGIMRFMEKNLYLFPFVEHPMDNWNKNYGLLRRKKYKKIIEVLNVETNSMTPVFFDDKTCNKFNPQHKKRKWVICDLYNLAKKSSKPTIIVLPFTQGQSLEKCIIDVARRTQFFADLENIGWDYIRSNEVDRRDLAKVFDDPKGNYWDQPLSNETESWTLRTIFPAFYNPGAIFAEVDNAGSMEAKYNAKRRYQLETRIRRELCLNWTYEFGRLLRTGACYLSGHPKDTKCYDYLGQLNKKQTDAGGELNKAILWECACFEKRTGLKMPSIGDDLYKKVVYGHLSEIILDYKEKFIEHKDAIIIKCKKAFKAKNITIAVVDPILINKQDMINFRILLALYPKSEPAGVPKHDVNNTLIHEKGSGSAWTLEEIFSDSFFDDIVRRKNVWKGNNNHIAFFYGDFMLKKEGQGNHISRYWRFFCMARTKLAWDFKNMSGQDFLNLTMRTWYENGMQHHVNFYIINRKDSKENYFDLSLGMHNNPGVPLPKHVMEVQKLIDSEISTCTPIIDFCTFDYFGYDLVQGQ